MYTLDIILRLLSVVIYLSIISQLQFSLTGSISSNPNSDRIREFSVFCIMFERANRVDIESHVKLKSNGERFFES